MPIFSRDDGVQFVVQTYRELLTAKKLPLLRRELRMLESANGSFVSLFLQPDGQVEAVFSQDPGYLLADTVWEHFNKPEDFIYCERLPDSNDVVMVAVLSGTIYLDTMVPVDAVIDELVSLQTGENIYDIYVYGDVPIAEFPEDDKFCFDSEYVKSFIELGSSLYSDLPALPQFKLTSLGEAFKQLTPDRKIPFQAIKMVAMGLGMILVVIVLYEVFKPAPAPKKVIKAPVRHVDPYRGYDRAMMVPSPKAQLEDVVAQLHTLYTMPGWVVTNFDYKAGMGSSVSLGGIGGSVSLLQAWGQQHGIAINVSSDGVSFMMPAKAVSRPKPQTIMNSQQTLAKVIDRIKSIVPGKGGIDLGQTQSHGVYSETGVTIALKNATPDLLLLIGNGLEGLPVNMSDCNLSIKNGVIDGSLKMSVVGD